MADSSFEEQLRSTREMLQYRNNASQGSHSSTPTPKRSPMSNGNSTTNPGSRGDTPHAENLQVELYLSPRFVKKLKKDVSDVCSKLHLFVGFVYWFLFLGTVACGQWKRRSVWHGLCRSEEAAHPKMATGEARRNSIFQLHHSTWNEASC